MIFHLWAGLNKPGSGTFEKSTECISEAILTAQILRRQGLMVLITDDNGKAVDETNPEALSADPGS